MSGYQQSCNWFPLRLMEGEAVMLLSNPQGSRWKITRGNVGLLWEFSGFRTRLQITAAITPGRVADRL